MASAVPTSLGRGMSAAAALALCEVIERDATSLWSLRPLRHCIASEIDMDLAETHQARTEIDEVAGAGFHLKAIDLTSDIGLPVIMTLIWRAPTAFP